MHAQLIQKLFIQWSQKTFYAEKFVTLPYLQKVIQMFEDTNTHFIQVFQEPIENWHQISSC